MIPKEILKNVKHIEIRTTKLVNELFGGEYHSAFKGKGTEFADVREYSYGDDIRSIDWNVTARTGDPYIKQFIETRELSVFFLVDVSSSNYFGSNERLKSEIAAEISALLAFAAVKNNDKVGLLMFTDRIEKYLPLKKGKSNVLRVIREILYSDPEGKGTDLTKAIDFMNKMLTRRAVIFLISDFMDKNYEQSLKILARYHDLVAIHIFDPREKEIPNVGYVQLEDAETGEMGFVNTNSKKFRKKFIEDRNKELEILRTKLNSYSVDNINIDVSKPYIVPLINFFTRRIARRSLG